MGKIRSFFKNILYWQKKEIVIENKRDGELTFVDLSRCLKYGFHSPIPQVIHSHFLHKKMPPEEVNNLLKVIKLVLRFVWSDS